MHSSDGTPTLALLELVCALSTISGNTNKDFVSLEGHELIRMNNRDS